MHLTSLLTALAVGTSAVSAGPRYQLPRQAAQEGAGQINEFVAAMQKPTDIEPFDPRNPAVSAAFVGVGGFTAEDFSTDPRFTDDFVPTDFGHSAGLNPIPGTGDTPGDCRTSKGATVPCNCPPDPNDASFRAALKVALNNGAFPVGSEARTAVGIDEWNDITSDDPTLRERRARTMIIVMQTLSGDVNRGVDGCPGASVPALLERAPASG